MVLTANAYFGYWQEGQAEQAMESLKQMSVSQCVVVRNDLDIGSSTIDLVPGDIIGIRRTQCSCRYKILESFQCKIDEVGSNWQSYGREVCRYYQKRHYLLTEKIWHLWARRLLPGPETELAL